MAAKQPKVSKWPDDAMYSKQVTIPHRQANKACSRRLGVCLSTERITTEQRLAIEMSRKNFYRVSVIAIFVIAGLLIVFLVWRQKANKLVLITQEQAFQYAIQACNPGYGLQPVEQPTEFQAELTTYEKTLGFAPIPAKAEIPVWVITMKGKWLLVGGPPPSFTLT